MSLRTIHWATALLGITCGGAAAILSADTLFATGPGYGVTGPGAVYTVNPATGQATQFCNLPGADVSHGGLARDPNSDMLFAIGTGSSLENSEQNVLWKIDRQNKTFCRVGAIVVSDSAHNWIPGGGLLTPPAVACDPLSPRFDPLTCLPPYSNPGFKTGGLAINPVSDAGSHTMYASGEGGTIHSDADQTSSLYQVDKVATPTAAEPALLGCPNPADPICQKWAWRGGNIVEAHFCSPSATEPCWNGPITGPPNRQLYGLGFREVPGPASILYANGIGAENIIPPNLTPGSHLYSVNIVTGAATLIGNPLFYCNYPERGYTTMSYSGLAPSSTGTGMLSMGSAPDANGACVTWSALYWVNTVQIHIPPDPRSYVATHKQGFLQVPNPNYRGLTSGGGLTWAPGEAPAGGGVCVDMGDCP